MKAINPLSKFASAFVVASLSLPALAQAQTPREIASNTFPSVVLLVLQGRSGVSHGSGFFVADDVVATNFHVIKRASQGYARIIGRKEQYPIRAYIAGDEESDLALLKLEGAEARSLPLGDDSQVAVGDKVYAVGNPLGIQGTLSEGIVNSVQEDADDRVFVFQAPVSPGSSGSPVLNAQGEVIGIAVGALEGGQNLNIAVPISYLRPLMVDMSLVKPLPEVSPDEEEPSGDEDTASEKGLLALIGLGLLLFFVALVLLLRKSGFRRDSPGVPPDLSISDPAPPEFAIDDPRTRLGASTSPLSGSQRMSARRRWWIATLLSLSVPGLGQVYNGEVRKGLLFYGFLIVLQVVVVLSRTTSLYMRIAILSSLIAFLAKAYIAIDAIVRARSLAWTYQLKSYNRWYLYVIAIAVSWFVVAPVQKDMMRDFVQAYKVPAGSMLPTLQIGDHTYADNFIYRAKRPDRGDVVIFAYPHDESRDFIKRVIGLPGEQILILRKQIFINGKPIRESYVIHLDQAVQENPSSPRDNFGPVVVPLGHVFVMGDNRDYSLDSRFWGFLEMKKIKGKASIIYWSWDRERFRPRWGRIGMVIR